MEYLYMMSPTKSAVPPFSKWYSCSLLHIGFFYLFFYLFIYLFIFLTFLDACNKVWPCEQTEEGV